MKVLNLTVAAVLAFLMLFSCQVPPSEELFIRADQADDGLYSFPVNMVDGTVTYSIWLYTVMGNIDIAHLPLDVHWTSPSGKEYAETVCMPVGEPKGDKKMYRTGLIPNEYGEWKLDIRVQKELPGFRGIGVICERHTKDDGSR